MLFIMRDTTDPRGSWLMARGAVLDLASVTWDRAEVLIDDQTPVHFIGIPATGPGLALIAFGNAYLEV